MWANMSKSIVCNWILAWFGIYQNLDLNSIGYIYSDATKNLSKSHTLRYFHKWSLRQEHH